MLGVFVDGLYLNPLKTRMVSSLRDVGEDINEDGDNAENARYTLPKMPIIPATTDYTLP